MNVVYLFEGEFLRYLQKCFEDIRLLTYAKEAELFNAMSAVTKFPAAFYRRDVPEWKFNKIYQIQDGGRYINICPADVDYTGRILVKNQKDAFERAAKLRFYWNKNPYITVNWTDEDTIKVGARLLSISVDEERAPDDKKGPMRYVEFKWRASLFVSEGEDETIPAKLVEQVQIYLSENNTIKFLDNNKLIQVIQ